MGAGLRADFGAKGPTATDLLHHTSMYVCMYGHYINHSVDQPGKVAKSACGQMKRGNYDFPVPFHA